MKRAKFWPSVLVGAAAFSAPKAYAEATAADLRSLSIEELANIEVTSVSKRAEPLSAAPAAINVITSEDIQRLGADKLSETLRLAPNLQVAQLDALGYAISARGFNSTEASNKLLVMIDGRSVYSPLHSGVFWDAQDVMLGDVDRIEVVSGPGGTLWGANAVNGVISVISKAPEKTQGFLVYGNAGSVDKDINARYGGMVGDDAAYRVYIKASGYGHSVNPNGVPHVDPWDQMQGGFAGDWKSTADTVTLQGDVYTSGLDVVDSDVSGGNVIGRWTHQFGDGSPLEIQAYYDKTHRNQPGVAIESVETYDLSLQHGFTIGARNSITWGGGYRITDDFFTNPGPFVLVNPAGRLKLANGFAQDEITLTPTLKLTAGMKVEHHTYTGFEYMPNVRLAWQAQEDTLLWAAVSRAVRTPSRIDRELFGQPILAPAPNFESEDLLAYEVGYRGKLADNATLSVSTYYNVYTDLRTTSPVSAAATLPVALTNGMEGHTYGIEVSGNYSPLPWWRLSAGVTALGQKLHLKPGISDLSNFQAAGNDPSYQFSVRSLMSPVKWLDVDVGLRTVDKLTAPYVAGYTEMDVRIAWHITDQSDFVFSGFNLLHQTHEEGGPTATRRAIRRSLNGGMRFTF